MNKTIMLTIAICCVTIFFVGCENGKIETYEPFLEESGDLYFSGEKELLNSRK